MIIEDLGTAVLFVHAHPDDETLATGATLATLVQAGVRVAVVTATRGEQGEAVPGTVPAGAELVAVREREIAAALSEYGGVEHFWLGEPPARKPGRPPGRYPDSGMRWGADGRAEAAEDVGPDAFTVVPPAEPLADLLALVAAWRPDLLVSYDAGGGYGHPDHSRCHQLTLAAATAAGLPVGQILPDGEVVPAGGDLIEIATAPVREPHLKALRHYRTQLAAVADDHVVHVGGQRMDLPPTERLLIHR